jgi:hypothetical protein
MPKLLKDLDLSGKGKHQRLKDFFNQYEVKTNFERNLIFVYYLNQILEISEVTVDSVFTCYREISTIKAPGALRQSLIDTSHNRGWIDTQDMDSISVTIVGINYIEHDMAKKVDA